MNTQATPEQLAALQKLGATFAFRVRSIGPGESSTFADLVDVDSKRVICTAAGLTESLALDAAIELAQAQFPASQGDGTDDDSAEHEKLLAEQQTLGATS